MLKFEIMNMMLESNDDDVTFGDDVTYGEDVDHEDNSTYIDIALIFAAIFSTLITDEKHISRAH
jgi:hypothetical protein